MKYLLAAVSGLIVMFVAAFFRQDNLIFFPELLPQDYQFDFRELEFEERFFDTGDARIHGLLFPAPAKSRKLVLYFHGNAGSLRTWGFVAREFVGHGYDVFIPDFRGYGKSTGKRSERALAGDALYIYRELSGQYDEIVIYGRSIGSGIACDLAGEVKPAALLLETPFYSMADLARAHYPFIPGFLLRYKFENYRHIENVSFPVSIIHGTMDMVVPFASAVRLAEGRAELTVIKGGGHNNLSVYPEYHEWLKKSLWVR